MTNCFAIKFTFLKTGCAPGLFFVGENKKKPTYVGLFYAS